MVMGKPTAREISMVFVRQYYTLLNEAPAQVHRFYSHDSSFVHGGIERDKLSECKPARGQKEINERIKKLCFTDARTKIRQVDAHPTLSDGVVIQVSGFMSNNAAPMRPFMQTFVLAPQSDLSYYVYNDIFRYQDELFSDDDEVGDAAVEADDEADMEEADDPSTVSSTTASASAPAGGGDAVSTTDGSQQLHYQQTGMTSSPGTAMKPQHPQRSAEVTENSQHHQNNATQHGMLNGHSQAVHAANAASGVVAQPQLSPQQPQQSAQHQHNNIASTTQQQQPCAAVPTDPEPVAAHGAGAGVLNCSGGSVDDADVVADAVLPTDDAQDGNTDAAMMDDRAGPEDGVTTTMTDAMVEAEAASPAPAPSPPPPPPPVSAEPKTYANLLKGNKRPTAPPTRHVEKELSPSSRSTSYAAAPATSTFSASGSGGGGGGGSSSFHHHQQQGHHHQHQQSHYYQQQGQASYGTTAPSSGSSAHGGPPSGSYPSGGAHNNNSNNNNGGSFHNSSGGGGGGGSFESAGDVASAGPGGGPSMEPERRRINIHPDAHQIFVGNLPQDVEPEELIEHFQQYGAVVDVKIHSSKAQKMGLQTRNYPFYGFVAFESADVVQSVLNQMPTIMVRNGNEHRLNIEHKQSRPMDGGRMGGGRGGFSRGGGGMSRGLRGGYGRGGGSDRGGGRGGGFHHQGQPPARR